MTGCFQWAAAALALLLPVFFELLIFVNRLVFGWLRVCSALLVHAEPFVICMSMCMCMAMSMCWCRCRCS